MRRWWLPRAAAILALSFLLAACGDYVPPVRADLSSPKVRADIAACQKAGDKEASRLAWAFFFNLASYPVSLPVLQRREITRCVTAKGYSLTG